MLGTFEQRTETEIDWHELEDMAERQASRDFSYKALEERASESEHAAALGDESAELPDTSDDEEIRY